MKLPTKKGFTLIELLLYLAITSFILTSLILFAWNVIGSSVKNTIMQETSSQARFLSERIKYEIRNALDINFSSSDFDINLANNPGKKLSVRASAPNDPTIIDVDNGKARIKQGLNAAVSLNSTDTNVTNLTFTNYSSIDNKTKHIAFTLTIQSNSSSVRQEYQQAITIESSAELRNN